MPGLFTLPAIPASTPTGGINITSSGMSLKSLFLSPFNKKSYISKWAMVLPLLFTCMSLIVPTLPGPPEAKRAFTRVDREDTV